MKAAYDIVLLVMLLPVCVAAGASLAGLLGARWRWLESPGMLRFTILAFLWSMADAMVRHNWMLFAIAFFVTFTNSLKLDRALDRRRKAAAGGKVGA